MEGGQYYCHSNGTNANGTVVSSYEHLLQGRKTIDEVATYVLYADAGDPDLSWREQHLPVGAAGRQTVIDWAFAAERDENEEVTKVADIAVLVSIFCSRFCLSKSS
jgi:hypothetical protein